MKHSCSNPITTTTDLVRRPPSQRGLPIALSFFALLFVVRPIVAADGGLPNGNTSEGDNALQSLTTGNFNTGMGFNALKNLTTAKDNTAVGWQALVLTNGNDNTATGFRALENNGRSSGNTATGSLTLTNNQTGHNNTATGTQALMGNRSGSNNTATGVNALFNNTASNNTAIGADALFNNTASNNTATGAGALFSNVGGVGNTADGYLALHDNAGPNPGATPKPDGSENTAVGSQALQHNGKSGNGAAVNTAVGSQALSSNDVGYFNTAVGGSALRANVNGTRNTAIGMSALQQSTGHNNIALGAFAGQNINGDNNIDIGNLGPVDGESGTIRLGTDPFQTATFIAGIYGQSVDAASGLPVQIDSTGKLGTVLSSARFKQAIKPMDKASEAVLALEPVTFQYKPELDPKGVPQFGLVAEQVEKVAPQLVVHDKERKPYTVRYDAVNAMLLNEFLKEHRRVAELTSKLDQQNARMAELTSKVGESQAKFAQQQQQIATLTSGLQKVSDQLQSSQPTLVAGNQVKQPK